MRRQVESVVASVTREYEVAQGTEHALENTLSTAKDAIQGLNRKEFQLSQLERDADSNRQMYDMFLKRAKETNISSNLQSAIARVVDAAVQPRAPVKPKQSLIISAALVLGLLLGVMVSLLLDLLDNTVKTTEDLENKLKEPVLTTLPRLRRAEIARTSSGRLLLDNPKSLYSEAIRTARTGVLLSAIDMPKHILLVTSSVPEEGKSTFSINLAAALAQTQRTLLIDADMRRPAVSGVLRLPQGAKGLSNLVSGTGTPAECIHALQGSQLAIMPAGTIPPNPLELLLSQRFKNVLEQLSAQYDVVVIDSPPVELVSDALVLGGLATGVLYVVKAVATPYQLARKGLQRLRRSNARILGVVLNQLDFETAEKYYGEYSGYGRRYSHGKGGRNGYWQGYGQPQAQPQAQPHEPLMAAKAAVPVAS